ncbi:MAG TPA: hypothetical protein VGA08_03755 [Candidatus Saccharimonadales bacterium]
MAIICPTVLADNSQTFREQIRRVEALSPRLQIDLSDGDFAPVTTLPLEQVQWRDGQRVDLHLMYRRPGEFLEAAAGLRPNLIIVHAEAEAGEVEGVFERAGDVKLGLALLPQTDPNQADVRAWLEEADHCLIFAGELGRFAEEADLTQLNKVELIRAVNTEIEIGWDGGVNEGNIARLAAAGVDVINVGGFIQKAADPAAAYAILQQIVNKV